MRARKRPAQPRFCPGPPDHLKTRGRTLGLRNGGYAASIGRVSLRTGTPVRMHIADGEVVVARILGQDSDQVLYIAVTSSRPEKYAVCDSTGFTVSFSEIDRVQIVRSD